MCPKDKIIEKVDTIHALRDGEVVMSWGSQISREEQYRITVGEGPWWTREHLTIGHTVLDKLPAENVFLKK